MDIQISVIMMTYNHGEFIKEALDSVLKQKVNVQYEILIVDDASTDNTRAVLREYKKKYPHVIRLYLRKRNSCHPTKNLYFLLKNARGKYYAILEGDDFWTDKKKLQTQYDFLEENRAYSACVCDVDVVDEHGNIRQGFPNVYYKKADSIYKISDFQKRRMAGRLVTLFGRNIFSQYQADIIYRADWLMGDITIVMLHVIDGNIYQMSMKGAAYRYVSKCGENNYNSMILGNRYNQYNQYRYWHNLECYMRKMYSPNFSIDRMYDIMVDAIINIPFRAVWKVALSCGCPLTCLRIAVSGKIADSNLILGYQKNTLDEAGKYSFAHFYRAAKKRPVIIFGAGGGGGDFLDRYAYAFRILFAVDNDRNKQGKSFKGIIVRDPDEIVLYRDVNPVILIANQKYESQIASQLQSMNLKDYYYYCAMQSRKWHNRLAVWLFNRERIPDNE